MLFCLLLFAVCLNGQVVPAPPTIPNPSGDNQHNRLAKVEGSVVSTASGIPLSKVVLTLSNAGSPQGAKYTAISDMEGVFLFKDVQPGKYSLEAKKRGFGRQRFGAKRGYGHGTPLTLGDGDSLEGVLFRVTPTCIISGKVTDEAGEPMDRVSMVVLQRGYSQGKRLLEVVRGVLTNDLGEFRIAEMPPGSYYVVARRLDSGRGWRLAAADTPSGQVPDTPEEGYWDTYFPNALDPSEATKLVVAPGSELHGVNIQLRKTCVFRVRGEVVDDANGQPVTGAKVSLMIAAPKSLLSMASIGSRIEGSRFEVRGVPAGTYYLMAQVTRNGQILYARQPIHIGSWHLTDVVIRVPRAVDVVGKVSGQNLEISTNGDASQEDAPRINDGRISLYPAKGFGHGPLPRALLQADGSFVFHDVVPDKYWVHVLGTPPGWYLKSVKTGGQERPDGIVEIAGATTMEITLAVGAASVSGSVMDGDDNPAPGAVVTLYPDNTSKEGRIDLFRTAITDQAGQFELGSVIPGSYRILAWQGIESDAVQDSEFRRPFESKANSLTLKENERETVALQAISIDDVAKALQ